MSLPYLWAFRIAVLKKELEIKFWSKVLDSKKLGENLKYVSAPDNSGISSVGNASPSLILGWFGWGWYSVFSAFTIIFYYKIFDNPFIHDDFQWIYNGKKIADGDFSTLFSSYGSPPEYYPFFINLLYGISFKLFGLNYSWYHIVSLLAHIFNSLLIYIFVYLYFKDRAWALFTTFFFALNPIISNAIIWPSAWVDLFATCGFLLSAICYRFFLDKKNFSLYIFAFLSFLISIFSKIIGIGLPFFLLFIEVAIKPRSKNNALKQIIRLSPFFLISLIYGIFVMKGFATKLSEGPANNLFNFLRYIPTLFVPENKLNATNSFITLIIFSGAFILLYFRYKLETLFIVLLLIITILPLTFLDFGLKPVMMLGSISHRLYLPSIGSQMLLGFVLSKFYALIKKYKIFSISIAIIVPITFLTWSYINIKQYEETWDLDSKEVFRLIQQMKTKQEKFPPKSLVYLINAPSASAFLEPMIRLYYNNSSIDVVRFTSRYSVPDFRLYQNVYIYLYLYGRLMDDHNSVMKFSKVIKSEDIGYLLKFYELRSWTNEKLEALRVISTSAYNDGKKHFVLALAYRDMGMIGDAEDEFKAALIIEPRNLQIRNELGLLYLEKKEYEKAIREFDIVAQDKSNPLSVMANKFIIFINKKIKGY